MMGEAVNGIAAAFSFYFSAEEGGAVGAAMERGEGEGEWGGEGIHPVHEGGRRKK
jgi:hypothetical protein